MSEIKLNEHFTYKKLIRFAIPSIVMMIVISIYSMVDGLFISNFCSTTSFASVNLAFPIINIVGAVGFMFGWGGSALFTKKLGEKEPETANRYFSLITYFSIALAILMSVIIYFSFPSLLKAMGAEGDLYEEGLKYGRMLVLFGPFFLVQMEFQSFFVAAEKSRLGLLMTIISGCLNIIFDAIFVPFMGVRGAALGTGLSQVVGAISALVYFSCRNNSLLRLGKTNFMLSVIGKAMSNGISELINNVSISLVSILYNMQLLKLIGDNGVAAYGIIGYVALIFLGIFFGYNIGLSPLVSYNLGAKNYEELKNLRKKSINIVIGISIFVTALSYGLSYPLCLAFSHGNQELISLAMRAFMFFSASFLVCGIPIFTSSFFTDLNDGHASGIVSIFRTLVFQILCVEILPLFWGSDGVWASLIFAEAFALVLAVVFLKVCQKKYHY